MEDNDYDVYIDYRAIIQKMTSSITDETQIDELYKIDMHTLTYDILISSSNIYVVVADDINDYIYKINDNGKLELIMKVMNLPYIKKYSFKHYIIAYEAHGYIFIDTESKTYHIGPRSNFDIQDIYLGTHEELVMLKDGYYTKLVRPSTDTHMTLICREYDDREICMADDNTAVIIGKYSDFVMVFDIVRNEVVNRFPYRRVRDSYYKCSDKLLMVYSWIAKDTIEIDIYNLKPGVLLSTRHIDIYHGFIGCFVLTTEQFLIVENSNPITRTWIIDPDKITEIKKFTDIEIIDVDRHRRRIFGITSDNGDDSQIMIYCY